MTKLTSRLLSACLVFLMLTICGCQIAVPFIQSFKDQGLTESDRVELFSKQLIEFNRALSDGKRDRILAFASDEFSAEFREIVRGFGRNEKVVNSTVDLVDFKEGSKEAEADVLIKYFKQTNYLVKDRLVRQNWEFNTGLGWYLTGFEVISEDFK